MNKAQGIAVSNGIAIGPCWIYRPAVVKIERCKIQDPAGEIERLDKALTEAKQQLSALYERALASVGASEAAIFEAHQLFLDDPEFIGTIQTAIQDECINAEAAVAEISETFASQMLALEDEYFQAPRPGYPRRQPPCPVLPEWNFARPIAAAVSGCHSG